MDKCNRIYMAIDLKSFYASVECIERGLNPMTTNLVVADASRTEKTICLAVSPPLKAYGIPGRPRLFEVIQKIKLINAERKRIAPNNTFLGKSYDSNELKDKSVAISYITASPRMALYMEYSTRIYNIYLKYIAPEDIHVYSIDEVFMDVTNYLKTYGMTPYNLARTIIRDILKTTGIIATAGIGTNMYLCKIAMDIVAKHIPADEDGVRIAELDEMKYRKMLWTHRPLTDFWRVGKGYAKKLESQGIFTMGDIARCSIGKATDYYNEDLLYKMFGVNAELLIDHAWGFEPCTIAEVKGYKPEAKSIGSGQVLSCPYNSYKAKIVTIEMANELALDLVEKGLVTDQIVLTIGYDIDNLNKWNIKRNYQGEITIDRYGRKIPKHAHGTANLEQKTSSSHMIIKKVTELYDRIINNKLLIRRINISANNVILESECKENSNDTFKQMDLFTNYILENKKHKALEETMKKERKIQETIISIKKRYGKNAVLKGLNFEEGATARDRNERIGGHKA